MSSFTILSNTWDDEKKIEHDLRVSSEKAGMRYFFKDRPNMQKDYNGIEQVLLWDIFLEQSYRKYMEQYAHLEPEHRNHHIKVLPNGNKLFRLATSDDSISDHIIYDLAKEYLRLNPDKLFYENWSETIISSDDIEKIESEGSYRSGWYDELKKDV